MFVKSEKVLYEEEPGEPGAEERVQPPEEAPIVDATRSLRRIRPIPWLKDPSFLHCFKQEDDDLQPNGSCENDGNDVIVVMVIPKPQCPTASSIK